jgi:hypothetical protein
MLDDLIVISIEIPIRLADEWIGNLIATKSRGQPKDGRKRVRS